MDYIPFDSNKRVDSYNHSMNESILTMDGLNYVYNTPYGKYSWVQPLNILKFENHYGEIVIDKSIYVLQYLTPEGNWLSFLDFINPRIITATNNQYVFTYDINYKYHGNKNVGTFTITFDSDGINKPKVTVNFNKSILWDSYLDDFRIIWVVTPSNQYKYYINNEYETNSTKSYIDFSILNEQQDIGNKNKVFIGKNQNLDKDGQWISISTESYGISNRKIGTEDYWNGKGITTIFPTNVSYIDPDITFTELIDSFTVSTGTSWDNNYDIYTNKGVPKGSIVEIVLCNADVSNERDMGVRSDGSSINRYYQLHEAEDGGEVCLTMPVKVDSSTGIIECYTTSTSNYFRILGYFLNTNFTELYSSNNISTTSEWTDLDLGTANNLVHAVIISSSKQDASYTGGIRSNGSTLSRSFTIHEPEAGGGSGIMFYVKSDSNDVIEYYISEGTSKIVVDLGYFDSTVDYSEKWTQYNLNISDSWLKRCLDPEESYYENDGWGSGIYTTRYTSQTFTTTSAYTIKGVLIRLSVSGTPSATVTVSIRATSSGKPTGSDLCSATIDTSSLTTDKLWYLFDFGSGYSLNSATLYSIVVRCPDAPDTSNKILIWGAASNVYSDGEACTTTNSGTSWSSTGYDCSFQTVGTSEFANKINTFILCNESSTLEQEQGVREYGSSLSRYVLVHESEEASGTGFNGYTSSVKASSMGIIEFYTGYNFYDYHVLCGYFTPVSYSSYQRTITYSISTSLDSTTTKNIMKNSLLSIYSSFDASRGLIEITKNISMNVDLSILSSKIKNILIINNLSMTLSFGSSITKNIYILIMNNISFISDSSISKMIYKAIIFSISNMYDSSSIKHITKTIILNISTSLSTIVSRILIYVRNISLSISIFMDSIMNKNIFITTINNISFMLDSSLIKEIIKTIQTNIIISFDVETYKHIYKTISNNLIFIFDTSSLKEIIKTIIFNISYGISSIITTIEIFIRNVSLSIDIAINSNINISYIKTIMLNISTNISTIINKQYQRIITFGIDIINKLYVMIGGIGGLITLPPEIHYQNNMIQFVCLILLMVLIIFFGLIKIIST